MYSTDPIADMLTRIRNAIMVQKTDVAVPFSSIKAEIAKILKSSQFIEDVKVSGEGKEKTIDIKIRKDLEPAKITEIERISKPGRRIYAGSTNIPTVKSGRGIVVLSTSKGVMSSIDARKEKIGGEVICSVY